MASCAAELAALVATVVNSQKSPEPKHTSPFTGQLWLEELLAGHPERFREP